MHRSSLVVTVGVTIGVGCTALVGLDKEHVLLDEAGHGGGVPAPAVCQPGTEEPCYTGPGGPEDVGTFRAASRGKRATVGTAKR